MSAPAARISAVVVDYFTRESTLRLIDDLRNQPAVSQVVVVDNTGDPSYSADWGPGSAGFELVRAPARQGYGEGANLGVRAAREDHVLVLNSDVRLVAGQVSELVALLETGHGVVGPVIVDQEGFVQRDSWGPIPAAPSGPDGPPRWITGACMLLRRDVFTSVGGFDQRFFMYWEDVDLCRRLWQEHRLTAAVCPTMVVRHQSGHSQGSEADRFARAARSRDLYLAKWQAPWTHRVRARLLGVGKRAYLRSTRS